LKTQRVATHGGGDRGFSQVCRRRRDGRSGGVWRARSTFRVFDTRPSSIPRIPHAWPRRRPRRARRLTAVAQTFSRRGTPVTEAPYRGLSQPPRGIPVYDRKHTMGSPEGCGGCDGGWVCEVHPDQAAGHNGCDGAGMPCENEACRYSIKKTGLVCPSCRAATGTIRRQTSRVIRFKCTSCWYEWLVQARNISAPAARRALT